MREIKWLSVYSRMSRASLAQVYLRGVADSDTADNAQLTIPRPLELAGLAASPLARKHSVNANELLLRSGPVTIVDAQTLLIVDFHFDPAGFGFSPSAAAPTSKNNLATYFWLSKSSPQSHQSLNTRNNNNNRNAHHQNNNQQLQQLAGSGLKLRDENGSAAPLRKYSGETIVISLPDEFTIYDFDLFGLFSPELNGGLASTQIAHEPRVPPSPRMLGIKPENKLNCEILHDELGYELRWVLDGDDIVMQLVGKIEPNEYMLFGLGKNDAHSELNNCDAIVAWLDKGSAHVHAADYFLAPSAALACQQQSAHSLGFNSTSASDTPPLGCPDTKLAGGTDSLTLLHGAIVNGYSMVTFKRPQLGIDEQYDQHVYSDGQQSVVWAIGGLDSAGHAHTVKLSARNNMFIDFARNPHWNCPVPDLSASMNPSSQSTSSSSSSGLIATPATTTTTSQSAQIAPGAPLSAASQLDSTTIPLIGQQQQQSNLRNSAIIESAGINSGHAQQNFSQSSTSSAASSQATSSTIPNFHSQQTRTATSITPPQGTSKNDDRAWHVPAIVCPSDRTFRAQLGPVGGKKAQLPLINEGRNSGQSTNAINDPAATSADSTPESGNLWPQAAAVWYINGLLLPELVLERGSTYRFIVEGGNDRTRIEHRHPLYLTDSPDGGYEFKTDSERQGEQLFAGVAMRPNGQLVPQAEGRLCEWRPTNATKLNFDDYPTFGQFQRSLKLSCDRGVASSFKFTPTSQTPASLYYQCYTHRNFGWKIRIVESCATYLRSLLSPANSNPANPAIAVSINN